MMNTQPNLAYKRLIGSDYKAIMEFSFISSKVITDSDYKVNDSQAYTRLMLNTSANWLCKGFLVSREFLK